MASPTFARCDPYWRPFASDGTIEYPYTLTSPSVYSVKKEFDLRFHCTWSSTGATPTNFNITLDTSILPTISSLNSLMKLTSPDGSQTGFVLPITVADLSAVSKQNVPVQINIANSQFKQTYATTISLLSGVLNLEIVRIDAPVLVNTMQEVQVKFGALGEPSCALISYKLNGITTYYAKIGSNPTACSVYYTNIKASYSSVYAVSSNVWKFGVSVSKAGLVNLFLNITEILEIVLSSQRADTSVEK